MAKAKPAKEAQKEINEIQEELVESVKPIEEEAVTVIDETGEITPEPEHLPRIEIVYDKADRKQPYKVIFYNCATRSVFQKMIVFTFQKALMVFRRNLIMEGEKNEGK